MHKATMYHATDIIMLYTDIIIPHYDNNYYNVIAWYKTDIKIVYSNDIRLYYDIKWHMLIV